MCDTRNVCANRCELCDPDLDSFEDVHDKRDEVLMLVRNNDQYRCKDVMMPANIFVILI